jgi:hypothetical protein
LGPPFGFNLEVKDVDDLLVGKIVEKIRFWSSLPMTLVGRAMFSI